MFTAAQVTRMEESLSFYRSSLFDSRGCLPLLQFVTDAEIRNVSLPEGRVCSSSFTPTIRLRNLGSATLNSVKLTLLFDQQPVAAFNWSGALVTLASTEVSFPPFQFGYGEHHITVFAESPNISADDDRRSDTLHYTFNYEPASGVPLYEGFENTFPPAGWQVYNPDVFITWQRIPGISRTGNASVVIKNFSYPQLGENDFLRMPPLDIPVRDSVFLSFHVAAAAYVPLQTPAHIFDSLKISVSSDCGKTFKTIYRKAGASLVTRAVPVEEDFIPLPSEWRKDSVSLHEFIGKTQLLVSFEAVNAFGNNIYLDDVQLYSKEMNATLKEKGFLVSPNPVSSILNIKMLPQADPLLSIQIFSLTGQKIKEIHPRSAELSWEIDVSDLPAGLYVVRAVFRGKSVTEKVIKK